MTVSINQSFTHYAHYCHEGSGLYCFGTQYRKSSLIVPLIVIFPTGFCSIRFDIWITALGIIPSVRGASVVGTYVHRPIQTRSDSNDVRRQ